MDGSLADFFDLDPPPESRRREFVPQFDEDTIKRAVDRAAPLAERLSGGPAATPRQAQVRRTFVRSQPKSGRPPGARLQAASPAYIKLALTLLWASAGTGASHYAVLSARERLVLDQRPEKAVPQITQPGAGRARLLPLDPHTTHFPLVDLAVLIGLAPPKPAGVQAIRRGLARLASEKLIWLDSGQGYAPYVQLRREDGSGTAYSVPGRPKSATASAEGGYFKVPPELWTNGWIAALTGRALITLLVLLAQQDSTAPNEEIWISPSMRKSIYGVERDTFFKGAAELAYLDLVAMRAKDVREPWTTERATRHQFRLKLERGLSRSPLEHL